MINKDQYKFGKELGAGAFGCVYSARHVPDSQSKKEIFIFIDADFIFVQVDRLL